MSTFELLRFSSLASIPLFAIIALFLIKTTRTFSLSRDTISGTLKHLTHPAYDTIFRFNFVFKGLLDLGFAYYLTVHFGESFASTLFLSLAFAAIFFAALAYFTEGRHSMIHRVLAYSSGLFWAVGYLSVLPYLTNKFFIGLSILIVIAPIFIGLVALYKKTNNAYVQVTCISIWLVWLLMLVFFILPTHENSAVKPTSNRQFNNSVTGIYIR